MNQVISQVSLVCIRVSCSGAVVMIRDVTASDNEWCRLEAPVSISGTTTVVPGIVFVSGNKQISMMGDGV